MNEVHAVKTAGQREQIEFHLDERGLIYLDIWKFGINTALRISDLLAIPMATVRGLDPDEPTIELTEQKTGKDRRLTLNAGAMKVVNKRLATCSDDTWLFQSSSPRLRKSDPRPVTRRQVARIFEQVGKQIAPRVRLGTHSMRKTRGYAMHTAGVPIESICKVLNHSHPAISMRYIGLDDSTVQRSYTDLVL